MTPRPARLKSDSEQLEQIFFASLRQNHVEAVALLGAFYQLDILLGNADIVSDLNAATLDATEWLLNAGSQDNKNSPYHALQTARLVLDNPHTRPEDKARAMQLSCKALSFYENSDDIRVLTYAEQVSGELYNKAYIAGAPRDEMAAQWCELNWRFVEFKDNIPDGAPDSRLMQSDADINAAATASTRLDAFMREDGTVAEALARFLSPAPAARG
jgi:TPR repeat protein